MKKREVLSLAAALLASGFLALAYHTLLTAEARDSISDLRSTFKDSKETIRDKIESIRGQIMVEEGISDNRMRTQKQWENLGY